MKIQCYELYRYSYYVGVFEGVQIISNAYKIVDRNKIVTEKLSFLVITASGNWLQNSLEVVLSRQPTIVWDPITHRRDGHILDLVVNLHYPLKKDDRKYCAEKYDMMNMGNTLNFKNVFEKDIILCQVHRFLWLW